MVMDNTTKQAILNSSTYGMAQSAKQAIYNNSKYGLAQAAISAANTESSEPVKYTLPDGRVLVRYPSSSRIDFKSLFGSIGGDDDDSDTDTLSLIANLKATSHSLMDAYAKQGMQNLGLD